MVSLCDGREKRKELCEVGLHDENGGADLVPFFEVVSQLPNDVFLFCVHTVRGTVERTGIGTDRRK
jgi:hypothetical protein